MADLTITAANIVAGSNADVEHGKFGATITAGQLIYKDPATGKYLLSDSNSATAAAKAVDGMALNGGGDNQPVAVLKSGDVTMGAVLTAGAAYYLSETPGGIQPVADLASGETVVQIGLAKSTSVLAFRVQAPGVTL